MKEKGLQISSVFVSKTMNKLCSRSGAFLITKKKYYLKQWIILNVFILNSQLNTSILIHCLKTPKHSNEEIHSLEENLTNKEMLYSLKIMNNNSATGSSAFTTSFNKVFWRDIWDFLVRSLNCAFQSGELSVTFKQGTSIPNGHKTKYT